MATTDKKDCDYCRRNGLQILPLRYAVAYGKTDDDKQTLGTLAAPSGLLGEGVTDVALREARYTTRLLRSGYLYPLVKRNGVLSCETVYSVSAEGFLRPIAWNNPKPNDHQPCQPGKCGINASTISIKEAKDVTDVYILYSPVPLSPKLLADYTNKSVLHKKAQHFQPKAWVEGNHKQKHTIEVSEWRKNVAEFAALDNPKVASCFKAGEVLFPFFGGPDKPEPDTLARQKPRLEGLENLFLCNKDTMAVVLHDPLGITQELNQARNQVFNFPTEKFLSEPFKPHGKPLYWGFNPDEDADVAAIEAEKKKAVEADKALVVPGANALMAIDYTDPAATAAYYEGRKKRLIEKKQQAWAQKPPANALILNRDASQVALFINQLKKQWDSNRVQKGSSYYDTKLEMVRHRDKVIIQTDPGWEAKVGNPKYFRGRVYENEADWKAHLKALERRSEENRQIVAESNAKRWEKDYAPLYSVKALTTFNERANAALAQGEKAAQTRTQDHLAWLKSPKIVQALAWYDTTEASWGVAYTSAVGEAISGLVGTKEGLAFLQNWAFAEKIQPDNLLLKALAFAQKEAEAELSVPLPPAKDSAIAWSSVQKNVGTFVKHFDKAHSVVDAFETGKGFTPAAMGTVAYSWLHSVHMSGYFKLMENCYALTAKLPIEKLTLPFIRAIVANFGSKALATIKLDQWLATAAKVGAFKAGRLTLPNEVSIDREFDALKADAKTNWAGLRIGTLLALLEVWSLYFKMGKLENGDEKAYMEYGAALLTTSAAGLELCGKGVDLLGARGALITKAAAETASAGLKLVSGGLGAIAGFVGIMVDRSARDKAVENNQYLLIRAYNAKIYLQIAIAGFGIISTFASSAPFLKYMAEKAISTAAKRGLAKAGEIASAILLRRAFFVITGFWFGVAMLGLSIVIAYLEDDKLQAWMRRSTWRPADQPNKPFSSMKQELDELGAAFSEIA